MVRHGHTSGVLGRAVADHQWTDLLEGALRQPVVPVSTTRPRSSFTRTVPATATSQRTVDDESIDSPQGCPGTESPLRMLWISAALDVRFCGTRGGCPDDHFGRWT